MAKTRALPVAPSGVNREFYAAVKESLEVLKGDRGDPLDRAVTFRDLIDQGVVLRRGAGSVSGVAISPAPAPPLSPTPIQPLALTNLAASGALANVILSWDGTDQYGYAHTEIWRASTDNLANAVLHAATQAATYSDAIGSDATYYYWVRPVSTTGHKGPYNATAGVKGQTGKDPEYVRELLTSQPWKASTVYRMSEVIAPTTPLVRDGVQIRFQVSTPGTSGTAEPDWSVITGLGQTVTDNTVVWTSIDVGQAPLITGTSDSGKPVAYMHGASIEDATITSAKIGTAAIDTAHIADAAITNAKIGSAAVGTANIATAAITNAKIGSAAVGTANIADAAISSAKIASAAISTAKIGDAQVDTLKIAGNAVTVPEGIYAPETVTLSAGTPGPWRSLATRHVDFSNADANASIIISIGAQFPEVQSGSTVEWRLLINGSYTPYEFGGDVFGHVYEREAGINDVMTAFWVGYLSTEVLASGIGPSTGANGHSIELQARVKSDASDHYASHRFIMCIGAKK